MSRAPQTLAEHAALRALCNRVEPIAHSAVKVLRARHHRVVRAPWRGLVVDQVDGAEVVIRVSIWIDPESTSRLGQASLWAARDLERLLRGHGVRAQASEADPGTVWVRGGVVEEQRAA